ncbi:MAG: right-handed parallel beta-helix repeat-containing protein [bacterium]|nr:right-handed parallel beta-helix repeat-containing protein [bacterium]
MKIFLSLIVGTQFIVSSLVNATNVSGLISANTVWNTAGSPYIVTGNILVDTLVRLDIQPGVEVRLDSAKYIMVKGFLNAIGTASDSIIITKNGTAKWSRIWLKLAVICSLKYCRIEYADSSAIYNEGKSTFIGYCTISNNSAVDGGGIYNYNYSSATITNNTISNNSALRGGGICNEGSATRITNNTITNNSASYTAGGGIYNSYTATITGNTISNNLTCSVGGGICNEGTVTITNNTIFNNSGGQYGGGGICNYALATITNNTISNNSGGQYGGGSIFNIADGSATIRYNTIIDTTSSAIYLNSDFNTFFIRTNNISATGYAVYNNTDDNIDARYNYWNTTDSTVISNKIRDFYDTPTKGKVFYPPFLSTLFSDTVAPPAPLNLTDIGFIDSTFEVEWTNPVDVSGISEYYYKLGSAPNSNFDTTGTFHFSPDTIDIASSESLFVWLVDSSGNVNYNNRAWVMFVGMEEQTISDFGPTQADRILDLKINKNPFIKSTVISYTVPPNSSSTLSKTKSASGGNTLLTNVQLTIHDISGREVRKLVNGEQKVGSYEVSFNAKGLVSGVYFATLSAGNISVSKKLILMK